LGRGSEIYIPGRDVIQLNGFTCYAEYEQEIAEQSVIQISLYYEKYPLIIKNRKNNNELFISLIDIMINQQMHVIFSMFTEPI